MQATITKLQVIITRRRVPVTRLQVTRVPHEPPQNGHGAPSANEISNRALLGGGKELSAHP